MEQIVIYINSENVIILFLTMFIGRNSVYFTYGLEKASTWKIILYKIDPT